MWARTAVRADRSKDKGDLRVPFFQPVLSAAKELTGLLDPVTLQALRANPNPLRRALDEHAHCLQVRVPAPLASVVRVADVVAGNRPLGAESAYSCHKLHPYLMFVTRKARKTSEPGPMTQPHTSAHPCLER